MYSGRPQRKRPARGFTLTEVLFAVTLLATAGTVFSATYPVSARMQASVRYREQAIRIARREMEALRGISFGDLTNASILAAKTPAVINADATTQPFHFDNLATDSPANSVDNSLGTLLPGGDGTVTVEDVTTADPSVTSASQTNLRRITVVVSWRETGKDAAITTITVQSLVSYLEAPK